MPDLRKSLVEVMEKRTRDNQQMLTKAEGQ
jgi:hypothetical protein